MSGALKIASDGQLRPEPARLQGNSTDSPKLSSLVAKVKDGPRITLQGAPKPQTHRWYTGGANKKDEELQPGGAFAGSALAYLPRLKIDGGRPVPAL